jgi:hypothetical protein
VVGAVERRREPGRCRRAATARRQPTLCGDTCFSIGPVIGGLARLSRIR